MRNSIPLAALLLALTPFACVKETATSNGSSSSIHATVLFPPNVSCTDAHWIQVRGSGSGNFESLEVDGVNASSDDGFLTWLADVPLDKSLNTLTVVGFRAGHSPDFNLDSVSITRDPLVGAQINRLSMTDQWGHLYAFAENPDLNVSPAEKYAVLSLDPGNGRTQVVSGWGVGSGTILTSNISAIGDSAEGSAVYLADAGADSIIRLDKVSGQRATFSSPNVGSGPTISRAKAMQVSDSMGSIYVLDDINQAIIAVSLIDGDRTLISSSERGTGPSLQGVRDIALDTNRGQLLASSSLHDGVLSVDLSSGDRELVAGQGLGEGPSITNLTQINYNANLDEIVGFEQAGSALMSVNPETGSRATLAIIDWCSPSQVVFDRGTSLVWIHSYEGLVFSYDMSTGAIDLLASQAFPGPGILVPSDGPLSYDSVRSETLFFGKGITGRGLRSLSSFSGAESVLDAYYPPSEPTPVAMSFDPRRDQLLLLQEGSAGLHGLGMNNGQLNYISGPGDLGNGPQGSGASLFSPTSLASGPGTRTASVLDTGPPNSAVTIDLLNGDRVTASAPGAGYGPLWTIPTGVATTTEEEDVFVSDADARIYRVSTETGARTIIGEYSGVAGIQSITHILADSNNGSLYVLDSASGTILKVSATSGLASVVHGESAQVEGLHWAPVDWTLKAESGTLILRTEEPATLIEFDPITGQGVVIAR